jgi:thiol-disulfide isomerase/thioredoxin
VAWAKSALLWFTIAFCRSADCKDPDANVPGYGLKAGMEIHYTTKADTKHNDVISSPSSDWKIWVSKHNDDGSCRLIIRYSLGKDRPGTLSNDSELACFDLFPNGRFTEVDNFVHHFDIEEILPRLPANADEMRTGWESRSAASNSRYRYSTKGVNAKRPDIWKFVQVEDGPAILLRPYMRESEFVFDMKQALIQQTNIRLKAIGGSGKLTCECIELKGIKMHDSDWTAALDRDMQQYLEAAYKYAELVNGLESSINEVDKRLDEARDLWVGLGEEVTNDIIREAAKLQLAQHNSSRDSRLAEAKKRANVIGRHAAQWERPDFEETMHKLSDYEGKVVLLHFWRTGSGLSIRSMPQVNQIVDAFADKPVVVLGMNEDYDMEEAVFVDSAMELKYLSLRINEEIAENYGVSTFPTIVVVDQSGIVREFLVGYAPRRRQEVEATIRQLLAHAEPALPVAGKK